MKRAIIRMLTLILTTLLVAASTSAQTSAFTYQGKFIDGGSPGTGQYDFQFKLFDTATVGTGTQLGQQFVASNVTVSAGIFSVTIDFAACPTCFNGAPRFLEIAVRSSGGSFVTLSPRQQIVSTPYAVKSQNAASADGLSVSCVSCVTSSQIQNVNGSAVVGTIPVASMPAGSSDYIQNRSSQQPSANFNISGTGVANIFDAAAQYNLGGSRILAVNGSGMFANTNTFVGIGAGAASNPDPNGLGTENTFFGFNAGNVITGGQQNAFFGVAAGASTTDGATNSFFGSIAGANNTVGSDNAFFGWAAGRSNTTGFSNSYFGRGAGFTSTTAIDNTFIGRGAGFSTTTGSQNSFVGKFAGNNTTTGSNNVFIGANSGTPNTSTQVNNSVVIGAGVTVTTSNTIILGTSAQSTQIPGLLNAGSGRLRVVDSLIGGGVVAENLYIHMLNHPAAVPHLCWEVAPDGIEGLLVTTCAATSGPSSAKTDVRPFVGGLEVINRLRPVTFRWKANGEQDIGFNTDDVAEAEPLMVTRNKKGDPADVRHENLSAVFVSAFKEQQAQIASQQEQIKQHQLLLERQQKVIESLKRLVCGDHPESEVCR